MPNDLDLDRRLRRVGDHLDALAAQDAVDRTADPDARSDDLALRREAPRPGGRHPALAAAALLVVAAVGGTLAVRAHDRPTDVRADRGDLGSSSLDLAEGADLLALRPVLAQAIAETCMPGWVPSTFGVCFDLGPAAFDADDVAAARAVPAMDGGGWLVAVTVADAAQARANAGFAACFEATAACPDLADGSRGRMAVVRLGEVVSVPAIQAPDLASDEIQISGAGTSGPSTAGDTRAEAEAFAALLS